MDQAPITEEVEEFGKIGDEQSYIQTQMHFDHDSAESIADSDFEDGELRKMLTSPLCAQKATGKLDAMVIQERGKCTIPSSQSKRKFEVSFF